MRHDSIPCVTSARRLGLTSVAILSRLRSHRPVVLLMNRWQSLTALNLSGCGLTALSSMVGGLGGLLELRLSDNKLTALPREIGLLRALRVLVADNNLLTALPGDLIAKTKLHVAAQRFTLHQRLLFWQQTDTQAC